LGNSARARAKTGQRQARDGNGKRASRRKKVVREEFPDDEELDVIPAAELVGRWIGEEELDALQPQLRPDLEALHGLITGSAERAELGASIAGLGERLHDVDAALTDSDAGPVVARLGDLLIHAGHAMRSPIYPSENPSS
jgi:hypothetical protein